MTRWQEVIALLLAATLNAPGMARAQAEAPASQPCDEGARIAVDFAVDWGTEQRQALLDHLRAGFDVYGVRVCDRHAASGEVLAVVRIGHVAGQSVRISVDVSDAVTRKRIGRDVDVAGYSSEGQALAIAVATEELVRASWVELRIREKPPAVAAAKPPAEVERVVEDAVEPSPPRRTQLGLRAAGEAYTGGQLHWGPDLVWRQQLARRFSLGAALGPRFAISEQVELGTLEARAFLGEVLADLLLVGDPEQGLALEASVRGGNLTFEGTGSGSSQTAGGPVVSTRSGLVYAFRFSDRVVVELSAGAGVVLVGADATGGGELLSGASGAEGHAGLGFGVSL